jgi:hypothetical protein
MIELGQAVDEAIEHLAHGLQAAGNDGAFAEAKAVEDDDQGRRQQHGGHGIGDRQVDRAQTHSNGRQLHDLLDHELVHRVDRRGQGPSLSSAWGR